MNILYDEIWKRTNAQWGNKPRDKNTFLQIAELWIAKAEEIKSELESEGLHKSALQMQAIIDEQTVIINKERERNYRNNRPVLRVKT